MKGYVAIWVHFSVEIPLLHNIEKECSSWWQGKQGRVLADHKHPIRKIMASTLLVAST